jgi:hypothetical protein
MVKTGTEFKNFFGGQRTEETKAAIRATETEGSEATEASQGEGRRQAKKTAQGVLFYA